MYVRCCKLLNVRLRRITSGDGSKQQSGVAQQRVGYAFPVGHNECIK